MNDFTDFTLENYKILLKLCKKNGYKFIGYNDNIMLDEKQILLRHDVDYSMRRAVKLAEIESEEEIKSTYFIFSHSEGYNLYETATSQMVKRIISLGHNIGLHVDYGFIRMILKDNSSAEEIVRKEIDEIQKIYGVNVTACSFHQPEYQNVLNLCNMKFAEVYNAYSDYILKHFKYCSDSNGYWRFDRLEDVIKTGNYKKIQILLHPVWWTELISSPAERIYNYYTDEAKLKYLMYCDDMKRCERINIGEDKIIL